MTRRGRALTMGVALAAALGLLVQAAASAAQDDGPAPVPVVREQGGAAGQAPTTPLARENTPPSPRTLGTLPPGVGVPPGERAPDADLWNARGQATRLAALMERGSVLLVFYRGGWCPYCNFQIRELAKAYPEFRRRGVTPVAVSVDREEEAARTVAAYAIPFPVLSDPDLAAHRAYRVVHQVAGEEQARLAGFGIDLERASGRRHHVIAIPAVFLIDARGVVRWAHADEDYKVRPSTAQILAVIDGLDLAPR